MIIIGLTGPIGHGKTTFADALAEIEPKARQFETSAIIMEVADAWHEALAGPVNPRDVHELNGWVERLPEVLRSVLAIDCSFEQLRINPEDIDNNPAEYQKLITHAENLQRDFSLARTPITSENKQAYRPILQWLGGYLVQRVDNAIWYHEIIRRIKTAQADGITLCTVGGLRFPSDAAVLREADGVIVKLYRPDYGQNDLLDPTERERDSIQADATIFNDGTSEDLRKCAYTFLEDLRDNTLHAVYHAAKITGTKHKQL